MNENPIQCTCKKPSMPLQILNIVLMIGMVGLGLFIMIQVIVDVANPTKLK
jgi:hypothetical protein